MSAGARTFAGTAGLAIALAALTPPFDALADRWFEWHMLQHLTLMFAAVPLLLIGCYDTSWQRRLPVRVRIGIARATHSGSARVLLSPALGWCALVAVLWCAHFSALYAAALEHPLVHLAEHALFVVAALLFWLPVIGNAALPAMTFPARLLYLFVALPQGALLAAALLAERSALYAPYVAALGPADALADQRNAAAVMWMGGGAAIFIALMCVAATWATRERRADAVTA